MRLPVLALGLLLVALALLPWLVDSSSQAFVQGQVIVDGRGAENARVRLQATGFCTRSDSSGRFRLTAPSRPAKITAWQEGYFIGSAPVGEVPGTIRLRPLPDRDHPDYAWVAPDPDPARPHNCGNCHREIHQEWRQSAHSRSVAGHHFRNLYEGTDLHGRHRISWGLLTQYNLGADVCASCHAPALPDAAPTTLDLADPADPVALHGVHCDYCHKIARVGNGQIGLTHGRFNLDLLRPAPAQREAKQHQLFFGPLDDVDRGEDAFAQLYRQSRYCASCHEGIVFGVHVYSTWSEWLASPARRQGQQCQDCHMKPTGRMTNMAPGHGGLPRGPATLANHRFFDGSQLTMLRRCVQVAERWHSDASGHRLTLRVSVEGVGHKVPTGLPDRQLLVIVEGQDAAENLQPLAGAPLLPSSTGPELAGKPGRLYAKLLHDREGHSPVPFWLADGDGDDNRLSPGQGDEMTLIFPPGLLNVRIRVLYRRFWYEVIRDKLWPDQDLLVLDRTSSPSSPLNNR